jgi:hypothetical protein
MSNYALVQEVNGQVNNNIRLVKAILAYPKKDIVSPFEVALNEIISTLEGGLLDSGYGYDSLDPRNQSDSVYGSHCDCEDDNTCSFCNARLGTNVIAEMHSRIKQQCAMQAFGSIIESITKADKLSNNTVLEDEGYQFESFREYINDLQHKDAMHQDNGWDD